MKRAINADKGHIKEFLITWPRCCRHGWGGNAIDWLVDHRGSRYARRRKLSSEGVASGADSVNVLHIGRPGQGEDKMEPMVGKHRQAMGTQSVKWAPKRPKASRQIYMDWPSESIHVLGRDLTHLYYMIVVVMTK